MAGSRKQEKPCPTCGECPTCGAKPTPVRVEIREVVRYYPQPYYVYPYQYQYPVVPYWGGQQTTTHGATLTNSTATGSSSQYSLLWMNAS